MNQSLVDIALFKAIKFIIKDEDIHSLLCTYLHNALSCKQIYLLPTSIEHARHIHQAKAELETSREMLDVSLQFHAELKLHRIFLLQLEHLPDSEIERLLRIFDTKGKHTSP